jgi:hypothetical protein
MLRNEASMFKNETSVFKNKAPMFKNQTPTYWRGPRQDPFAISSAALRAGSRRYAASCLRRLWMTI